jgi:8-oxo-dGTP pyrophosphatase MutT (NUDIX family)
MLKASHVGIDRRRLISILRRLQPEDESEVQGLQRTQVLLARGGRPFDRSSLPGHITASAFVFTSPPNHLLLIRHPTLNRWLQPGGHIEAVDASVLQAAIREVHEETGLADLLSPLGEVPLDVEVQDIPATKSMPAHQHHDIRMLLTFEGGSEIRVRNEVLAASWFATGALRSHGIEGDILKAVDKALRVLGRLPREQP